MNNKQIQQILKDEQLYSGQVDGIIGPNTMRAVATLLYQRRKHLPPTYEGWSNERKSIAAAQFILSDRKFYDSTVDGIVGYATEYALSQWEHFVKTGSREPTWRQPEKGGKAVAPADRERVYGIAGGPQCTAGIAYSPFKLHLSWDLKSTITSFKCHEKVAKNITSIYRQIAAEYSVKQIEDLGLNIWGGCYNFRKSRGGSTLSTHAYGIAVDIDPVRNQLRWGADKARLAKPDAKTLWEIVESEGATSLGRTNNYDWMHFNF